MGLSCSSLSKFLSNSTLSNPPVLEPLLLPLLPLTASSPTGNSTGAALWVGVVASEADIWRWYFLGKHGEVRGDVPNSRLLIGGGQGGGEVDGNGGGGGLDEPSLTGAATCLLPVLKKKEIIINYLCTKAPLKFICCCCGEYSHAFSTKWHTWSKRERESQLKGPDAVRAAQNNLGPLSRYLKHYCIYIPIYSQDLLLIKIPKISVFFFFAFIFYKNNSCARQFQGKILLLLLLSWASALPHCAHTLYMYVVQTIPILNLPIFFFSKTTKNKKFLNGLWQTSWKTLLAVVQPTSHWVSSAARPCCRRCCSRWPRDVARTACPVARCDRWRSRSTSRSRASVDPRVTFVLDQRQWAPHSCRSTRRTRRRSNLGNRACPPSSRNVVHRATLHSEK